MIGPTLSHTYPLSEGIHDAYTAAIETENLETRIILVSTKAFDELSEMKVPPVRYYQGNIGLGNHLFVDSRQGNSLATLTITNLDPVRKTLTTSYAQLYAQSGKCSLTVSPNTASSLRGEHFKIIYYKNKASFENKKEAVFLPNVAIYRVF